MQKEYPSKVTYVWQKIAYVLHKILIKKANKHFHIAKRIGSHFKWLHRKNIIAQRMENATWWCCNSLHARNFRSNAGFENALRQLLFTLYCYYTRTHVQRGMPPIYIYVYVTTKRYSFFPFPQKKILCEKFQACALKFVKFVTQFVTRITVIFKIYTVTTCL